jgi:MFS family permease
MFKSTFKNNILKAYLFKFFVSLHFIGGALIPFFLDWGKISFTQVMILQSIFVFSVFLFEVPTGAVADYISRKSSLILGALITGITALIYSSYPSFYIFVLGEILWALSHALISGADEALIYDSLKKAKLEKKSKKILGRYFSMTVIAITIAAPIGSLIANYLEPRFALLFMSIPMFIAALIGFTLKEPQNRSTQKESTRYLETLTAGVKYFLKKPVLRVLALDSVIVYTLAFFIIWTYQLKLREINVDLVFFGFVTAGMTILQIIILNNFDFLEKIVRSKKNYLLISALIPGVSFIILALTQNVVVAVITIILIAGFGITRRDLMQNYLNKHIQSKVRATVISTISMLGSFLTAVLNPFLGIFTEKSSTYTLMVIGILMIVFALISRVEERHLID